MEALFIFMSALALSMYALRLSLCHRLLAVLYVVLPALVAYAMYPWLAEQSLHQWESKITQPPYREPLALLLIAEACIGIGSWTQVANKTFGTTQQKKQLYLYQLPMLSPILVLAYAEMKAFYWIEAHPFYMTTFGVLAIGLLSISLSIFVLKKLIPEWNIRLELSFILACTLLGIGVFLAGRYPYIATPAPMPTDMLSMSAFLLLTMAAGAAIGYGYARHSTFKR